MANCLVTKLKEVVNDVEIPELGSLVFTTNPGNEGTVFTVTTGVEAVSYKILSGAFYSDEERTTLWPAEGTLPGGYKYNMFYNDNYGAVSIGPKYGLYSIYGSESVSYNLDDLWYVNLTRLESSNPNMSGDIETLYGHIFDNYVKVGRQITREYPVYICFSGTKVKFHGSTEWQVYYSMRVLRDTTNPNIFNIYKSEYNGTVEKPVSEQYVFLLATYNADTKVWNYVNI